jgi:hypothetical protein
MQPSPNAKLVEAHHLLEKHLKWYLHRKAHRTRAVTADETRWQAFTTALRCIEQVIEDC